MNPVYLGDIELNEETLAHYGIKGMKWGKRKAKLKADLKWKKSKLKNKMLELQTKKNRKKTGINDPDKISNKYGKKISVINNRSRDNGRSSSRTSATGNFQYKIDGKTTQATTNEGYSKKPDPNSVTKTYKNYKGYDSKSGTSTYTKRLKTNTSGQTTKWEPETRSERQAYTYSKTVNNPELKKHKPEGVSTRGGKNGGWTKYNTNAQNMLGADYNDVKKGLYGRNYSSDWESDIGLRSPHNPVNKKKKKENEKRQKRNIRNKSFR